MMYDDIPEWRLEQIYQEMERKRKEQLSAKRGRPVLDWGGKRPGSGRKKQIRTIVTFKLELNKVQQKVLAEMGDGSIDKGVLKLINENM